MINNAVSPNRADTNVESLPKVVLHKGRCTDNSVANFCKFEEEAEIRGEQEEEILKESKKYL